MTGKSSRPLSAAWRRRCFCLSLLASAALPLPLARAEEPVAQVVRQQGAVLAIRRAAPRALALGAPVFPGDLIVTRAAARVAVEFRDGSLLAIGSESEAEIAAFSLGSVPGDGGLLRLLTGILRATLSAIERPKGLDIATRAAVASARSTDWIVESHAEGTAVFVVEGAVEVSARDVAGSLRLSAGEGTDVAPGAAPAPPKRWGEKRVADVLARTAVP